MCFLFVLLFGSADRWERVILWGWFKVWPKVMHWNLWLGSAIRLFTPFLVFRLKYAISLVSSQFQTSPLNIPPFSSQTIYTLLCILVYNWRRMWLTSVGMHRWELNPGHYILLFTSARRGTLTWTELWRLVLKNRPFDINHFPLKLAHEICKTNSYQSEAACIVQLLSSVVKVIKKVDNLISKPALMKLVKCITQKITEDFRR